jgi:RsiW-degrading membrane proteinase PrsW (M82 family)
MNQANAEQFVAFVFLWMACHFLYNTKSTLFSTTSGTDCLVMGVVIVVDVQPKRKALNPGQPDRSHRFHPLNDDCRCFWL